MDRLVYLHTAAGRLGLRLLMLHILWIIGTVLGLGLLGVLPATRAAFVILLEDQLVPKAEIENRQLFKRFFAIYKSEFLRCNRQMMPWLLVTGIVVLDLRLIGIYQFGGGAAGLRMALLFILSFLLAGLANLFLLSNPKLSMVQLYKLNLIFTLGKPLYSFGSVLLILVICSIYYVFPGVMMVFGLPLIVLVLIGYLNKKIATELLLSSCEFK